MASPLVCREGSEKSSCYDWSFTSYIEIHLSDSAKLHATTRKGGYKELCHHR
jgi:hypothetical protein